MPKPPATLNHTCTDAYGEQMDCTEPVTLLSAPELIRQGVCITCGEIHPLPLTCSCASQKDADRWATSHCDCPEGEPDREAYAAQERYNHSMGICSRKRQGDDYGSVAAMAQDNIQRLFGEGAAVTGRVQLDQGVLDYLHATAMMVYIGAIGKMSVPVTEEDSAKIAMKKGVLTISRKGTREQSLEVLL